MKCVFCGCNDSKVVDSRYLKDTSIRRRRECIKCGKRFTTYETVETNPMIVTNVFNEREPFKLEKLIESLRYATYCQGVSEIQELAENIEQALTTKDIVKVTIDKLSEVDNVSAVVYYTQHTDCSSLDDIRKFINN